MNYDVFTMCNPLFDIQAEVTEPLLARLPFPKGSMSLIEGAQQQELIGTVSPHVVKRSSGGSGANTSIGLALLGARACYAGKIGLDATGDLYTQDMQAKNVQVSVGRGEGTTGVCVVMITPDAERTMCTYLGICREFAPGDVDTEAVRASKYLYCTGYLWDTEGQKEAVLHAMRTAKEAGVKIAFSLSDPFCVGRHKADFLQIARDFADLLIGNDEEMRMLTDTNSAREAIAATVTLCPLAVETMGADGLLLREGEQIVHVPAHAVQLVDTNGAGDMAAAAILYGLTHDLSLEQTGRLAAYLAAQVVAQLGPRLERIDPQAIADICGEGQKQAKINSINTDELN